MSEAATAEEMGMPKQGDFCWTEIATNDLEACKNFYADVFGWEIKKSQNAGVEMDYREYNLPGEYPMGGLFNMMPEMYGGHVPPPHFMNYISVDDVDAVAANIEGLGGKLTVPPMDIPNVGRFCVAEDPAGAHVALLRLDQM